MPDPITIPLSLAPASQSLRPAVAWLVPSADPSRCLDELCAWGVDFLQTRLIPLPGSRVDLYASAFLAIPPKGSTPTIKHALPYGWQGSKLLVPIDAVLRPAITDAELDNLITAPVAVWHPVIGLVECDDANGRRIWDLLQPARLLPEDWSAAQHGEESQVRLQGIAVSMESLAADPFGGAGEEIGRSSPKELPPTPGEPSGSAATRAANKLLGGMLKGGAHLAAGLEKLGGFLLSPFSGAAGGGSGPKPGSIRAWLEKQSAAFFERLDRARNKEIHRLMDWLNKDPEMALKFALPLSGLGEMNRGIAPPGVRLGLRNTNFQLSGLGGGGPADYWDLENSQRIALTNKYRELANRALAEGRHRRAAYIFAQLLGEIASAASALHQGRFYAEAAVLYRDRLQNKRMAAKCLEEGGMLVDAAKILEELGEWVEAGNLHARIDHHDEARQCYEKAVYEALQRKDSLRAAVLLEHKLANPTEALQILRRAWPDHTQALACLTAQFDFHVRHQQSEAARACVGELRQTDSAPHQDAPLCTLLTALSRTYPDDEVRRLTRVLAVTVASRVLNRRTPGDARRVLHTLSQLHPHDLLFKRDAQRFLSPPPAKSRPVSSSAPSPGLKLLPSVNGTGSGLFRGDRIKLPGFSKVIAATSGPGGLAVLGDAGPDPTFPSRRWLQLACLSLHQPAHLVSNRWLLDSQFVEGTDNFLTMAWLGPDQVWLRHTLAEPFSVANLGITPDSGNVPLRAGTLHTLPLDTIAVDSSDGAWLRALRPNGTVICQDVDGRLLWTHDTPFHGAILRAQKGFAARRDRIVIALENSLHVVTPPHPGSTTEEFTFVQSIVSFAVNSPHARPLIAVGLDQGIGLLPLDKPTPVLLPDFIDAPLVAFSARGMLFAFSEDVALAVQMRRDEPAVIHRFPWKDRPVALAHGAERDQIIAVHRDATYEVITFREKP